MKRFHWICWTSQILNILRSPHIPMMLPILQCFNPRCLDHPPPSANPPCLCRHNAACHLASNGQDHGLHLQGWWPGRIPHTIHGTKGIFTVHDMVDLYGQFSRVNIYHSSHPWVLGVLQGCIDLDEKCLYIIYSESFEISKLQPGPTGLETYFQIIPNLYKTTSVNPEMESQQNLKTYPESGKRTPKYLEWKLSTTLAYETRTLHKSHPYCLKSRHWQRFTIERKPAFHKGNSGFQMFLDQGVRIERMSSDFGMNNAPSRDLKQSNPWQMAKKSFNRYDLRYPQIHVSKIYTSHNYV